MLFSRLALAAITVSVSHAQREYWIDPNCPADVEVAVKEAQEIAGNVLFLRDLEIQPDDEDRDLLTEAKRSFNEVLEAIFPGATPIQLRPIWESYESLQAATPAEIKPTADILIYCDNDRDWVTPPTTPKLNFGYWDPNDFFHFWVMDKDKKDLEPSCTQEGVLAATYGVSYTTNGEDGDPRPYGEICRITLCDSALPGGAQAHKYNSFDPFREKDLSKTESDDLGEPRLGDFDKILSRVLDHEWKHTQSTNPFGLMDFSDVEHPNSYGWQNIRRLALAGLGLRNADSASYLGLASQVIMMGLNGTPSKIYYFDLTDGTIRSGSRP